MERFGFIHEKLDIKILILFVLRRLPGVVDAATLCDLVQCDDGIDYFDYSDCLAELVDAKQIRETKEGYKITEKGAQNGASVESSLPFSVRTKAEKAVAPVAERLRRMALITAKHLDSEIGCTVTLAMSDGMGDLISMKLLVPDEERAKKMEKNFRLNAEELYASIIELISGEKEI